MCAYVYTPFTLHITTAFNPYMLLHERKYNIVHATQGLMLTWGRSPRVNINPSVRVPWMPKSMHNGSWNSEQLQPMVAETVSNCSQREDLACLMMQCVSPIPSNRVRLANHWKPSVYHPSPQTECVSPTIRNQVCITHPLKPSASRQPLETKCVSPTPSNRVRLANHWKPSVYHPPPQTD